MELFTRLYRKFEALLFEQVPAEGLAIARMVFGALMVIDAVNERGMSIADSRWSDPDECRFPLISGLRPLPLEWMVVLYALLVIGALGICLGCHFRVSCAMYATIFWYLLTLDKSYWNNHSYLFGLIATLFTATDANKKWSLDSWNSSTVSPVSLVPNWNYFLFRFQIFLVYFLAGVKKIDVDWLSGYSMRPLSDHWTFAAFRLLLPNWAIDLMVVHWGGFAFDLTAGFLFAHSKTRPLAYLLSTMFNGMNSQLFHIGMFPFVMMAMHPIFSHHEWPSRLLRTVRQETNSCVAQRETKTSKDVQRTKGNKKITVCVLLYMALQVALPFSHFVTLGYNTWTNGPYGYSWDMMVHNWNTVHVRVTALDKATGERLYIDTESLTATRRWVHHADMVKQFASCAARRLESGHGLANVSIFLDAWVSLNGRFVQRVYDPRVDIVTAEWSPFERPSWVFPMMEEFSSQRRFLKDFEAELYRDNKTQATFVADFPGLTLINYVNSDFANSSLKVLSGKIALEQEGGSISSLSEATMSLKSLSAGRFHRINVVGPRPACFVYIHTNSSFVDGAYRTSDQGTRQVVSGDDGRLAWMAQKAVELSLPWTQSARLLAQSLDKILPSLLSK